MSGVFGQRLPRRYSATGGVVISSRYSVISSFSFRHVKYEYDCVKPALASAFIIFGRVNASARKIVSGCDACTFAMSHSQKDTGLVCGLSTRKIVTPRAIQNVSTR